MRDAGGGSFTQWQPVPGHSVTWFLAFEPEPGQTWRKQKDDGRGGLFGQMGGNRQALVCCSPNEGGRVDRETEQALHGQWHAVFQDLLFEETRTTRPTLRDPHPLPPLSPTTGKQLCHSSAVALYRHAYATMDRLLRCGAVTSDDGRPGQTWTSS